MNNKSWRVPALSLFLTLSLTLPLSLILSTLSGHFEPPFLGAVSGVRPQEEVLLDRVRAMTWRLIHRR